MSEKESGREYVLGTHQEELERLGLQHRAWRAQAYEAWERAGFGPGQRLLDVGCGPGFASLDLARLVGAGGSVTSIDVSRRFLDHLGAELAAAKLSNVTTLERDVQALDLAPGSFDGAWSRWVLSFLPDPARMVEGVARALRPGATFAIQEYVGYAGMRLSPPSTVLARVAQAVEASWRAHQGEADVALRLPPLLEAHGLEVRELRPISRLARPGSALWQWPESFFLRYLPTLVAAGHLSAGEQRAFEQDWRERSRDPHAFFVSPTVLEIVARKRG